MAQLPYVNGMDFGVGLDLLSGEPLQEAVTGTITPVTTARGQTVESKLMRIDSLSTLHKTIGISVEGGGSYMGFSGSAKVNFADSCNFNEYSTYFLISIRVEDVFERLDDPVLIVDAVELLRNNKAPRFRERFGDAYIHGMKKGGEYFGLFQISGTDETEKHKATNTINAGFNGLITSAELATQLNEMRTKSKHHLQVTAYTFQRGGSDTSQDQTIEQMMNKARNFAPSVAGEFAVPYAVSTLSYKTLNLPEDAANPIDIENQREVLEANWRTRTQLLVLKNNIEYVLFSIANNYDEFERADTEELTKWRNGLVDEIDLITKEASQCVKDAAKCKLARFDISHIRLPKHRAMIRTPKLVGIDEESAKAQITALGLLYSVDNDYTFGRIPNDLNKVTLQSPPEGTMVAPGSQIMITISRSSSLNNV